MKNFIIVCATGFLIGCAHNEKPKAFPPSAVAVNSSISSLHQKLQEVKPFVKPEGEKAIKALEENVFQLQIKVGQYVGQVDEQARDLFKSQEETRYWHDKQIKGLKEIWFWRFIALAVVAATVIWIGIKTSWKFIL